MRIVPINSVLDGAILANNIFSENGDILLKKGVVLTRHLIDRIVDNGVYTVYVNDGYSDTEIHDIIEPEVRQKATQAIKKSFKQISHFNVQMNGQVDSFKKKLEMKSMDKYLGRLKSISEYIVDDIANSRQLMINLVDIKNVNNYLYEHSLSVAILATVIGIELKLNKHQLYNLFLGSVLHDVGKLFISKDILNQTDPYSIDQQNEFDSHTRKGYDYLKENYNFEIPARLISLQHHECVDGTGFPLGMEGDSIHIFSRIVAVCNTYDNMISDTPQQAAIPVNEALEFIMGNAGACFDFKIVDIFTRKINPYPVGTLVELSNGQFGVVIQDHANYPLRPIVQRIQLESKKVLDEYFDLMIIKDIVIKNIHY